ncbi:Predicted trehalose synthase [Nannocystis exedens]|uniref:Predicted trehalose synthase n=1 Tax=Nannocystis exedens TaxID=54 RepID=A0A1I1YBQ8_9BACT|nr:phosphotransferase [Nannocystis exedens]PCC71920.1 Maltokinase [Nannocystis exedens]SFE16428.1 Predicted trehalose synthase [Nannocystis exedens]
MTAGPALDLAVLADLSSETWLAFLAGRRWFPAGARAVKLVGAAKVGDDAALCLLAAEAERPWTTQVLLRTQLLDGTGPQGHAPERRIEVQGAPIALVEASDAPEVLVALAAALRAGAGFPGQGACWTVRASAGLFEAGAPTGVRLIGGEQSNTAAVLGEAGVFKLFRRIEAGRHPEIEIGRFLTARNFPYAPPLLAELTVDTGEGPAAAGVLHAFLPGRVDGWTYALGQADMTGPAHALGVATRALHEVLTTDDEASGMATRAVVAADRARWVVGLRQTAASALGRLANRYRALPPEVRALAEVAASRSEALLAEAEERLRTAAGVQIRIHGDYHLGQCLYDPAAGKWSILDFEGEPTRPLAERSLRQLPQRDVAGMLRSFAYAGLVGKGGRAWEEATSAAFLAGYDAAAAPGSPLPSAQASPLLRACVIERSFHELAYELDYRPDFAWVPLQSLVALSESLAQPAWPRASQF